MGLFSRKSEATATAAVTTAPSADLAHLTGEYTIDPTHSEVGFSVRHAMVTTVRGQFAEYEGKLQLDGSKLLPTPPPRSRSRSSASTPTRPSATSTCAPVTSSTPRPTRRSASGAPPPSRSTTRPTACTVT